MRGTLIALGLLMIAAAAPVASAQGFIYFQPTPSCSNYQYWPAGWEWGEADCETQGFTSNNDYTMDAVAWCDNCQFAVDLSASSKGVAGTNGYLYGKAIADAVGYAESEWQGYIYPSGSSISYGGG